MKMVHGSGTIVDYASYTANCTLGQMPYRIPVNSLADVQLYIQFGDTSPGSGATYELIHTCGATSPIIEMVTPQAYVIGQDTNGNYYGVFQGFYETTDAQCFVIAITIDGEIYFSEEYCFDPQCPKISEVKGCYGNVDPLISYDREDIYFGISQGGTMGDPSVVYQHRFLMRDVEITFQAIKNEFKQGRTRTFRTESVDTLRFWGELIPEWYLLHVDAVFKRGEVFINDTKYLVDNTGYDKLDECLKNWQPTVTLKESQFQSFSCEADPCTVPVVEEPPPPPGECCNPTVDDASVVFDEGNTITIDFTPCTPTPANGYVILWRVEGSGGPYTNAGNFTTSPAVFAVGGSDGTQYEGFIYSDCGDGVFGSQIPWHTSTASPYSIARVNSCTGLFSDFLISGGTLGDIVHVRYTYTGAMQLIGGLFVRADLETLAPDFLGLLTASSPCYSDMGFHGFTVTQDRTFTMTGTTASLSSTAVVNNSSSSFNSLFIEILDVNSIPVTGVGTSGCSGNSSTGGTC